MPRTYAKILRTQKSLYTIPFFSHSRTIFGKPLDKKVSYVLDLNYLPINFQPNKFNSSWVTNSIINMTFSYYVYIDISLIIYLVNDSWNAIMRSKAWDYLRCHFRSIYYILWLLFYCNKWGEIFFLTILSGAAQYDVWK